MKLFYILLILLNLGASIYLIFRVISYPHGSFVSRFLRLPKTRSTNIIREIYSVAAFLIILLTLFFYGLTISLIASSALCFLIITYSKILVDISSYFIVNSSRKFVKLSSALTFAMFNSVYVNLLSLGIMFEN